MPDSYPSLSDAGLVKQAKSGDAEAFGQLYERYAPPIFRFLAAQMADRLVAEDLTADVFLRAWQSLPRYRERGHPFSAYLFKIARNAVIDWWRKNPPQPETSLEYLEIRGAQPPHSLAEVESETLSAGLRGLPADYQQVIVLRFINGFSPREVAQIMARSEGAVRVLQHRALKALRKKMLSDAK